MSPVAWIHDQWDLSYQIQQHNVYQGQYLFFLQWLRVMSEKTYFFDWLCYSHLIGTEITHDQLDVPAWGSLNGCCDFSNGQSSTFAAHTDCVGFSVRYTGVLRIGCCHWAHSLDSSVLIFLVWNTSKSVWGWETLRLFQVPFSLPGL